MGDGQWLVHNVICKWGNPKSTPTYGHTFLQHGEGVRLSELIDRARGLGHQNGQFLDDYEAARILGDLAQARGPGVYEIPIPEGLETRVVLPDGTEVEADFLRLVIKNDSSIRTSFPFSSNYP